MNVPKNYLLLFLLIPFFGFSQNWSILNKDRVYYFQHSDSTNITDEVQVLSHAGSLDTIFYTNTTYTLCDTCTVIPTESSDGNMYHFFQPGLFGYEILKTETGGHFFDSERYIQEYSNLSDSWLFEPATGTNATIVLEDEMTILGEIDSIKMIELSTFDTIILSKNHGIVRYPDFDSPGTYLQLVGYYGGGNSFGLTRPNAHSIYDFEIGDEFHYYSSLVAGYDGSPFEENKNIRIIIQDKIVTDTSISYNVQLLASFNAWYFSSWELYVPGAVLNTTTTLDIFPGDDCLENYACNHPYSTDSHEPPYNSFLAEVAVVSVPLYYNDYDTTIVYGGHGYSAIYGRAFGVPGTYPPGIYSEYVMFKPASNSKHADHAYIKSDSLGYFSGAECGFFGNYQNGIGTTYESYDNCFEGYRYITLKGFIKDGVSYGELTNLPDDLGIDSEQTELLITPNPSIDFIRLDPSLDQLEIFSLSGERISFLNITNGKVDISELNAGLYIVHAYRGDTLVGISKFSKL